SVIRLRIALLWIILLRRGIDRPARLVAGLRDRRRRPQFVGIAVRRRFGERRNLQRELGAARAWAGNRRDPDDVRALLDLTGFHACGFGLGTPGFTLRRIEKTAAAACHRDENERADEIQGNSARHPRTKAELP